jgi:hypothetical protein
MKFVMEVTMNNAAFNDDGSELPRILHKLADDLERYDIAPGVGFYLLDINGNHVGDAKITK